MLQKLWISILYSDNQNHLTNLNHEGTEYDLDHFCINI